MTLNEHQRERDPRIFRLDPALSDHIELLPEPDFLAAEHEARAGSLEPVRPRLGKGSLIGKLFRSALSLLFSLWIGVYGWHFIETLFATSETLGWIGAMAAGVALLALVVLVVREGRALSRLDDLAGLRSEIEAAIAEDNRDTARLLSRKVVALYKDDPESAASRAEMETYAEEIIDGPDLLTITERVLLKPRDAKVHDAILVAAKRVSLITTLSPRALVDVLFVGGQSIRLIRRISEIYGGRPGLLSFLRLGRRVVEHLAITGGIAVTDGVLSQVLGAGLAARLSAKLGEGVLNGILTARVGLVAIAICRPMPFIAEEEPKLSELASGLIKKSKDATILTDPR